jgi:[protein-PII] uridylyltransferase
MSHSELSDVEDFARSLPSSYSQGLTESVIRQHLGVALRRGDRRAEVGLFDTSDGPHTGLCVIADDRPGLLASISETLLLHGLDVISAQIYTRHMVGRGREAVDLFELRPQSLDDDGERLSPAVAESIRDTLLGIHAGPKVPAGATTVSSPRHGETTVRFIDEGDSFTTLEIETSDRTGLLLTIAMALTRNEVQIVGSLVNTTGDLVFDRFKLLERDGSAIDDARRRQLQRALLSALDGVHRSRPVVSAPAG